jgi:protein gp37
MTGATEIQWADASWNPSTGCDRVSPGCDHCYAMTQAKRLKAMGQARYQRDGDPRTSGPGFGVSTHQDALDWPLRKKKPLKIFVNSMSDLFHDAVPDEFIAQVFAVMAATPQHTYQILTKRHARMRSLLNDYCRCGAGHTPGVHFRSAMEWAATPHSPTYVKGLESGLFHRAQWPLPNVWLGVSVEDQHWADIRIPALLETPAAVRFLSCEPLLGPVHLERYLWLVGASTAGPFRDYAGRTRGRGGGIGGQAITSVPARDLHWMIVGGESGPGARPMEIEWAQSLVRECREAGVTPFVKQLGAIRGRELGIDSHGADWDAWPADLRVREFPARVQAVA